MHLATAIFALTYLFISLGENSPRKLDRPTAAMLGAVLMVMSGSLTRGESAAAIDLSTLALLFGMMVLLAVMTRSGLPTWLAVKALHRCDTPQGLLALVIFSSGISSALVLNDTVCLLGTPLLLHVTARAKLPATPYLLALATAANVGSVMTLTGNPQNMIIGHASGWGWAGFAARMVPVGLACLVIDWLVLRLLFRRLLSTSEISRETHAEPYPAVHRGLALKSVLVFAGLLVAFLAGAPMDFAAVTAAIALLVLADRPPREALEAVDWSLLLFFAGLFVVVEGFVKADRHLLAGAMEAIGTGVGPASVAQFSVASVVGSNLFSNVPFVLIVGHWVGRMSEPRFVWLLLALTSTFAGNLTLFGSVANIIVAQGAQDESPLGFRDFLRAGVPVTLATTTVGVVLLWALRLSGLA